MNLRGVTEYTPLYELPAPFHAVHSLPCEEFHLVKEGVVKLMLTRIFESKSAETVAVLAEWSGRYERTMLPHELPRSARKIQVGQFKGSEFGVLAMAGLPSLIDIFENRQEDHW